MRVSVRMFPERLKLGGKTHSEMWEAVSHKGVGVRGGGHRKEKSDEASYTCTLRPGHPDVSTQPLTATATAGRYFYQQAFPTPIDWVIS